VDRIIDMKKNRQDTSDLENHIDQLVYRLYQPVEKVLIEQAVQKSQVQGTKKVQGRSVFRHT